MKTDLEAEWVREYKKLLDEEATKANEQILEDLRELIKSGEVTSISYKSTGVEKNMIWFALGAAFSGALLGALFSWGSGGIKISWILIGAVACAVVSILDGLMKRR